MPTSRSPSTSPLSAKTEVPRNDDAATVATTTAAGARAHVLADPAGDVPDQQQRQRPAAGDVVGRRGEVEQDPGRRSRGRLANCGPRVSAAPTTTSRHEVGDDAVPGDVREDADLEDQGDARREHPRPARGARSSQAPVGLDRRRGRSSCPGGDDDADEVEGGEVDERLDDGALGGLARGCCRPRSTRPTGMPATYGAPSSLPQVTTTSPLAGTTVSSTSSRSSRPSLPSTPRPRRKPASMLLPIRPPTTESPSTTSSTVAVVLVTRSTRPTRPSLLTTVMSGCDAGAGAGVDGDRPREGLRRADADHAGRAPARSRRLGGGGEPVELREPVAVEVGGRDARRGARRSPPRARRPRSRSESCGAEPAGDGGERATTRRRSRGLDRPEDLADARGGPARAASRLRRW